MSFVAVKKIDMTSLLFILLMRKISSIREIVSRKIASLVFSVVIAPLMAFIRHQSPFRFSFFINYIVKIVL